MPVYKLSLEALEGLNELCYIHGYYDPSDNKQNRGIAKILNNCQTANIQWIDERPQYARDSDTIADEYKQAHIWSTGSTPRKQIDIGQIPITYLANIAHENQIKPIQLQRVTILANNLLKPHYLLYTSQTLAGAVIEAIGLKWLQPTSAIPRAKTWRIKSRYATIGTFESRSGL